MKQIINDGILYALHDEAKPFVEGSRWYGEKDKFIQAQKMCYNEGKTFIRHRHKTRKRVDDKTNEAFIVVHGAIKISVYTNENIFIGDLYVFEGDIAIVYDGFHEIEILEDKTIAYEIKNGKFTSVEEDKEYV